MNLRTLLVLGRVSNLPTVWSNLLTGWIISEGELNGNLLLLLVGGSALYVGGMYLNDFCDAEFDTRFCPQRPIPSGKISRAAVGRFAVFWFVLSFACLASFGAATIAFTLMLIAAIVLYDFRHKDVAWAPVVMGICRALLYLLAASAARGSEVIRFAYIEWPLYLIAATLGAYVSGITIYARGESRPRKPIRWALMLLLMPVLVQLAISGSFPSHIPLSSYFQAWPWEMWFPWPLWINGWLVYGILFLAWDAWLLIPLWRRTRPSIGRVVAGLLAGIVLVDMIALAAFSTGLAPLFLVFFMLALLLQRFVPAT